MVFLGLLSVAQAVFLPGFLLLYYFNLHRPILRGIILTFGLSLILNVVLVYLLTFLHLYTIWMLFLVIATEITYLSWLMYQRRDTIKENKPTNITINITPTNIAIAISIVIALAFFIKLFWFNLFNPYLGRDAFESYHLWAMNWSNGQKLTALPAFYPQLLPIVWSLSYTLLGTPYVQSFCNITSNLFPFAIFLMLADLGIQTKERGYWIAIPVCAYLLYTIFAPLNIGIADIPVSFFATAVIYLLLLNTPQHFNKVDFPILIFSFIMAIGACMTKKAGLLILFALPFLYAVINKKVLLKKTNLKRLMMIIASSLAIILILYYSTLLDIHRPPYNWHSLLASITHSENLPSSYTARIGFALGIWHNYFGTARALLLAAMMIFSLTVKKRYLNALCLIFVLPAFLIWMIFFSYDLRNLNIILPGMAILAGFGLNQLLTLLTIKSREYCHCSLHTAEKIVIGFIAILVLASLNLSLPKKTILSQQLDKTIHMSTPKAHDAIYQLLQQTHYQHSLLSNWQGLSLLPGLNKHIVVISLLNLKQLTQVINTDHPAGMIIYKLILTQNWRYEFFHTPLSDVGYNNFHEFPVDQFIQQHILQFLPAHYKIIMNTRDVLLLQFEYNPIRLKSLKQTLRKGL